MKYQGGKGRIARRLVDTMIGLAPDKSKWVEPFVGGAWVLEEAAGTGRFASLHAGDAMPDLITLYRRVADGWVPPSQTTRSLYAAMRNGPSCAMRALVGFGSSYGGTFFAGFCGDTINSSSKYTNAELAANHLLRRRPVFQATELRCCGYEEWDDMIGPDTLLYCDPPYAGTHKYRGLPDFDHDAFWTWCQGASARGAAVFVSEYNGHPCAEEVWSRTAKQTMARHVNHLSTERLFMVR